MAEKLSRRAFLRGTGAALFMIPGATATVVGLAGLISMDRSYAALKNQGVQQDPQLASQTVRDRGGAVY